MIPRRIKEFAGSLVKPFTAPRGWDTETQGNCSTLWVRIRHDGANVLFESAWEPTEEELKILNAGGSVVLRVVGGQPPVWVDVEAQ